MGNSTEHNVYDYIIIGSGLGGLICACILSKEGYKVLVLEKNKQIGGNLQIFSRDKLIFDTGVHYIGGLNEGQNLNRYFSYLGIMKDLKLEKLKNEGFDKIFFSKQNRSFEIPQGYENFFEKLLKEFPHEAEGIRSYAQRLKNCCEKFPLFNLEDINYDLYEPDLRQSVWDALHEYFKDAHLIGILLGNQILYAGNPKSTPFYVHALTFYSYLQGAYKCLKGGNQIALLLAREIRKNKGEILKLHEVETIHIDDLGNVEYVETQNAKKFYGKNYISNIPPKKWVEKCRNFTFKKSYKKRLASKKEAISSFNIYIKLKDRCIPYSKQNYYFLEDVEGVDRLEKYEEKNWPTSFMLCQNEDPENKNWCESLSAFSYLEFSEVEKWKDSFNTVEKPGVRGEDYEKFKEEKSQLFIEKITQLFPQIKDSIESIYSSSPLTQRDYLGNERGEIYGFTKEIHDPYLNLTPPTTPIKNLHQTGQYLNMHGILGVTINAILTCSSILGKSYLVDKIKKST